MFPLAPHTIFLTLAGSQAQGTAREGSDVDIRGVCIVPLSVRLSLFHVFEQHEGPLDPGLMEAILPRLQAHPTASRGLEVKTECVVFDVAKFLRLCAGANPNALEILFADEHDWLFETPPWRRIHERRHRFLTKKVQQTFLGYALAQLKKIRTHRAWLLHPPARKPTREDFGLPPAGTLSRDDQQRIEQGIADKIRSYGIDTLEMPKPTRIALQQRLESFWQDVLSAPEEQLEERMRALGTPALNLPEGIVAALNAEKKYRAAMKHWESYEQWKVERNPARAKLERLHGYDTKHATHLIRLMRMGLEVLRSGDLVVRRPDAAELVAVRDGAWTFEALLSKATELQEEMKRAAATSDLPADVDYDEVDRLAVELMGR